MMSQDEKLNKIGKDVNAIKRWWPVITVAAAILITTITITESATSTWDNKVAKKDDIVALGVKIDEVSKQVEQISNDFKVFKASQAVLKTADSSDRDAIKKSLDKHIRFADGQFRKIADQYKQIASFHEQYYYDKTGKRNVKVIAN